jgi:hypothetical protein
MPAPYPARRRYTFDHLKQGRDLLGVDHRAAVYRLGDLGSLAAVIGYRDAPVVALPRHGWRRGASVGPGCLDDDRSIGERVDWSAVRAVERSAALRLAVPPRAVRP